MFDEKYQNNINQEMVSQLPLGLVSSEELALWLTKNNMNFPKHSILVNGSTKRDKVMMKTAFVWSEESYCKRRKVGAVIAKDGRILANGYNGTIAGTPNNCEDSDFICDSCKRPFTKDDIDDISDDPENDSWFNYVYKCQCGEERGWDYVPKEKLTTNEFTMHAEQNAIAFCAKEGIATKGCTMYITTSPCKTCAKLIASVGIVEVVYAEKYKDTSGVDFLNKLGITTRQWEY